MSLRLLVDEDTQARLLVERLRAAGHDVQTATEADLIGQPDPQVLAHARREGRLLLTRNGADFLQLHRVDATHPGILAVYQDADPAKNMSYADIVNAIAHLEGTAQATEWQMTGELIILNHWRQTKSSE